MKLRIKLSLIVMMKDADQFALDTMINKQVWNEVIQDMSRENIVFISKTYKISPSFIVGRLAYQKLIDYNSNLYNSLKNM